MKPAASQSIVQALVLHTLELGDLLQRTGGQSFFENDHTVYDGPLPSPLLTGRIPEGRVECSLSRART